MSDKTVEERVSVLENEAEYINASLTRIERMLINLRSYLLKNQAQNYADLNATRRELELNIESRRGENAANFAKLETRLKESIGGTDSNLNEFKKETAVNFEKLEARLKESIGETDSNLSEFKKEMAANFAKLETRLKESIGETDSNLREFKKETAPNFAKTGSSVSELGKEPAANCAKTDISFTAFQERIDKIYRDFSKDLKDIDAVAEATQSQVKAKLARHKMATGWIIIALLIFNAFAIAESIGLLSLVGKLCSGG